MVPPTGPCPKCGGQATFTVIDFDRRTVEVMCSASGAFTTTKPRLDDIWNNCNRPVPRNGCCLPPFATPKPRWHYGPMATLQNCNVCHLDFPLTSEFWHRQTKSKSGLSGTCKGCARGNAHYSGATTIGSGTGPQPTPTVLPTLKKSLRVSDCPTLPTAKGITRGQAHGLRRTLNVSESGIGNTGLRTGQPSKSVNGCLTLLTVNPTEPSPVLGLRTTPNELGPTRPNTTGRTPKPSSAVSGNTGPLTRREQPSEIDLDTWPTGKSEMPVRVPGRQPIPSESAPPASNAAPVVETLPAESRLRTC
jgi:hypothetical protein